MNPFKRRIPAAPAAPAPQGDLSTRVAAMNAGAVNAKTPQEAIGIMQDAAGITGDLYKSMECLLQHPGIADIVSGLTEDQAQGIPSDLLKSFQAITSKKTPKAEDAKSDDAPADDAKPDDAPSAADTKSDDLTDEPTEDSPEDKELAAPAAAPEAIAAATGKAPGADGEDAPTEDAPTEKPLAKSFAEIVAEAQAVAGGNGAEVLVNANDIIVPMLKSIAATQQHQVETGAAMETTNEYLEQLGSLLHKSLEGLNVVVLNQQSINERLDRMEQSQELSAQSGQQTVRETVESFNKSFGPVLDYINRGRQAPQATPTGAAPFVPHAVQDLALSDAVPIVQEQEEMRGGFTRGELKKSIEAHLRSDDSKNSGITTAHYLDIGRKPLSDLDRSIFEVAAKTLGRVLPATF